MHRPISSDIENDHCGKIRKRDKPMMEKKRRARINKCLSQLKQMLMQDEHKKSAVNAKWEKADILEMTVDYLKNLRSQLRKTPDPEEEPLLEPSSSTSSSSSTVPCESNSIPSNPRPYNVPAVPAVPAVPTVPPSLQQFITYQQLAHLSMYNSLQNSVLWHSGMFNQFYVPSSVIIEQESEKPNVSQK